MSKGDFRLFREPSGRNPSVANYGLAGSQTFEDGEVVALDATGLAAEASDDPTTVAGIAAVSSQGRTSAGLKGSKAAYSNCQLYLPEYGQIFITENFATDGAGTPATPTILNIGDTAGFTLASGVWYVDTGASNVHVEIVDLLDVNKEPITSPLNMAAVGVTPFYVLFGFL